MKKEYEPKTTEQKLAYLVEECGEVMAAVGKTLRWGLDSVDPTENAKLDVFGAKERNRTWILREMQDLKQAIEIVENEIKILPREDMFSNGAQI